MPKKKEIEMLIDRYRADIAALEEREENLRRRIEILENLIPIVLVWYMWKVSQASREVRFPQHESEEEARQKMDHLEGVLAELQEADELLKEEEKKMRTRIEELERSLEDKPDRYPDKMIDIAIPKPIKPGILHEREPEDIKTEASEKPLAFQPDKYPDEMVDMDVTRPEEPGISEKTPEKEADLKIRELEDKRMKLEELLQDEDTDWKKVCEDLLKQVSELNDKLKDSSQKLIESEDYVKHLKEEYSKLEKELESKIQLLEKRTDSLISEIVDKEQEKYLQEELESKEALSALQEALAEVKSMKESLSISKASTLSKDDHIEPPDKATDLEEYISGEGPLLKEAPDILLGLQAEDLLPKPTVLSPEEVIKPDTDEKLPRISVPIPQIFEPEVALPTETAEPSELAPEIKTEPPTIEVTPFTGQKAKESTLEGPSLIPDLLPSEPTPLPTSETPEAPETPEILPELVTPPEAPVVFPETEVSKESVTSPTEVEIPISEIAVTPEIPQIPDESKVSAEDVAAPSETPILEEAVPRLSEAQIPETLTAPEMPLPSAEPVAYAEGTVSPTEITVSEEATPGLSEAQIPETPPVPEIPLISDKLVASAGSIVSSPELPVSKEATPELSEEHMPETPAITEIPLISPGPIFKEDGMISSSQEPSIPSDEQEGGGEVGGPLILTSIVPEGPEEETPYQVSLATESTQATVPKARDSETVISPQKEISGLPDEILLTGPSDSITDKPLAVSTEPDIPTTEPEIPTTELEIPTTEPEIPITEPEIPTTELEIPITEPEIPPTEPEIPTIEPEIPITEPEIPTTEPKIPITEPEIPPTEPEIPTTEPEIPTKEPEIPTTEPEIPTTKPEIPTIEPEIPTTELEIPATEPEIPTTELEIPMTELEIPTTEPEIPTTEPEIPTTEPEIPTTEPEIPTTEPEIPTTEPEIPTTEPEIPTVPAGTVALTVPSELEKVELPLLPEPSPEIPSEEPAGPPTTEVPVVSVRLSADDLAPTSAPAGVQLLQEPSKTEPPLEPSEIEPPRPSIVKPTLLQQEVPVSSVYKSSADEGKPHIKITSSEMEAEPIVPAEPITPKTAADGTEAQAIVSEPMEVTPPAITPTDAPTTRGLVSTPEQPTRRPSGPSLAAQTLQGKIRVKDHLIKSMADQLRELARNNVWAGDGTLEAATSADPVKTYDFDRNTLLLYLKGEEPQNYTATMESNEDYSSSNPLQVKIVRKLDQDSLMIEWGPPPSADVVGFQVFVNGQFMYWVHSAKRNVALLHPLDLKILMEIAVSPIDDKGNILFRSTITYKPE